MYCKHFKGKIIKSGTSFVKIFALKTYILNGNNARLLLHKL